MLALIAAIGAALDQSAELIAADWTAHPNNRRTFTGDQIRTAFTECARGLPDQGIRGYIRPQFTPDNPRLMGAWSF